MSGLLKEAGEVPQADWEWTLSNIYLAVPLGAPALNTGVSPVSVLVPFSIPVPSLG